MSTAPLLPGSSLPKPPPTLPDAAVTASVVLRAQTLAAQHVVTQRLREAANAAATAQGATSSTSSTRGGSSSLNQVYSQVWSAVTRNVRQLAVRSSDTNAIEVPDADASMDGAIENNDDGVDEGNDKDTETHGKHLKHGEGRGAGDRNGVKQKTPSQPKPKQNQQHKQKRKRRQSEAVDDLDACDDAQRIDPWASAQLDYGSDIDACRALQTSMRVDDIELIHRLTSTHHRIEAVTDTKTILRETNLFAREHSNELIWALGVLAALLLVLTLIVAMSGHEPAAEPTAPPKASQGAAHQGQEDAQSRINDKAAPAGP